MCSARRCSAPRARPTTTTSSCLTFLPARVRARRRRRTTPRGERVNPNLYENGKVCLSLRRPTWSGKGSAEMWDPRGATCYRCWFPSKASFWWTPVLQRGGVRKAERHGLGGQTKRRSVQRTGVFSVGAGKPDRPSRAGASAQTSSRLFARTFTRGRPRSSAYAARTSTWVLHDGLHSPTLRAFSQKTFHARSRRGFGNAAVKSRRGRGASLAIGLAIFGPPKKVPARPPPTEGFKLTLRKLCRS